MPQEQRQMGYMMMVISPIMIIWISLQASSALGLYWSVSALFLVIQTHFANVYYSKLAKKKFNLLLKSMKENIIHLQRKRENTQVVSKRIKIINNNLRHQSLSQVFLMVDANVLWLKHELTIYLLFEFTLY